MLYDTNNDLEFRDKENYWITDLSDATNHPERYKVRQYTGLKDSEGNEIYEGDILQMWEKTVNGTKLTHICKVYQHENGKWMMEGHLESDSRYRTRLEVYSYRKNGEVVGNIYEYPELID